MKQTTIIGIILALALMLAVVGCGDKEEISSEPVPAQTQESAEDDAPEETIEDVPEGAPEEEPEPEAEPEEGSLEALEEDEMAEDEPVEDENPEETEGIEDVEEAVTAATYKIISLKDLKAYPEEIHTPVGSTVEWRNVNDNLQHIIGWRGQTQMGVRPEPMLAGESWSYTFTEPGEFKWFSTARPTIQGTIYIEE